MQLQKTKATRRRGDTATRREKERGHGDKHLRRTHHRVSASPRLRVSVVRAVSLALCLALCACSASAGRVANLNSSQQSAPQAAAQQPSASDKKPRAAVDPNKFALIVAGVGGEEAYTKK